MNAARKVKISWRYGLLLTVVLASGPVSHFINQALRGHPLDINYFWSELSPFGIFGGGFYNGNGGVNWKIGQPKATAWNGEQLRSVPELRTFALDLVNRDRQLNNLNPLVEDVVLSQAAQNHAQDMLDRNYFDHISPEGKTPRHRFIAVGGSPSIGVGENIIKSSFTGLGLTYKQVEKCQRGWMYSNGHRANLLTAKITKFGYGIVTRADGQIYAVQMFSN